MKPDIDPDLFLSKVFQLRDELVDFGDAVFDERLTTIILDALPGEMYSTVKMKPIRDLELEPEDITSMTETSFRYHSERSSVPKRSEESFRKES